MHSLDLASINAMSESASGMFQFGFIGWERLGKEENLIWVVVSNIFYFHPENWGR